jgi:hypothetical protein
MGWFSTLMPADEFGAHTFDIRCTSGLNPLPPAMPSASKNRAGMPSTLELWMKHGDHTPPDEFPGASPGLPQIQKHLCSTPVELRLYISLLMMVYAFDLLITRRALASSAGNWPPTKKSMIGRAREGTSLAVNTGCSISITSIDT